MEFTLNEEQRQIYDMADNWPRNLTIITGWITHAGMPFPRRCSTVSPRTAFSG